MTRHLVFPETIACEKWSDFVVSNFVNLLVENGSFKKVFTDGQQFRRIFEQILCAYPVVNSVNSKKTTLWMVFYRSRYNLFSLNIPLNTQETSQRL